MMHRAEITPFCAMAIVLIAVPLGARGDSSSERPDAGAFVETLERLVPILLRHTRTPGIAVALIEDREVVYQRGFGFADVARETEMSVEVVFNVGSISKSVTAWGVMRLVEAGTLELDRPVIEYIPALFPTSRGFDPARVTVRRLLSHTAGLSMPAVPEYHPDDARPDLWTAIADSTNGVALMHEPGTAWAYSGGGYMLLQLLVERLAGEPFEVYMRERILRPLGMESSSFGWSEQLLKRAATGYDGEHVEAPYYRYVGKAAASLNSSVGDLSRFLVASLATDNNVLNAESVRLMRSPAPHAVQRFGMRYGLGYDIWNLAGDKPLVGHNGQNTGWAAAAWISPIDRSGIVILTNHSDGMDAWRWILCDWVQWRANTAWRGLCTDRPGFLPEPHGFWRDAPR